MMDTIWKSNNQVAEIAKKQKKQNFKTKNQPRKELYTLKTSGE